MTDRVLLDLSAPVAEVLGLPRHVPVRPEALAALRRPGGPDLATLADELEAACLADPAQRAALGEGLARLRMLSGAVATAPPAPGRRGRVAWGLAAVAGALGAVWFFALRSEDTTPTEASVPSTAPSVSTTVASTSAPTTAPTTTTTTTTTVAPASVPAVVGAEEADAIARLEAEGLVVDVERVASYDQPPGIALGTDPAAGVALEPGAAVTLRIAARPAECNDAPPEIPVPGFDDLTGLDPEAVSAVSWAGAIGLISPGPTFGPDDPMTRGAAVTVLWRYMCEPGDEGNGIDFADVPPDAFYAAAVRWASSAAIVGGTSPTTFSPEEPISRAAFIAIVWRSLGEPDVTTPVPFTDVDPGSFSAPALQWAVEVGLVNGTTPTTFSPDDPLSRLTTIVLFDRLERTVDPLVG